MRLPPMPSQVFLACVLGMAFASPAFGMQADEPVAPPVAAEPVPRTPQQSEEAAEKALGEIEGLKEAKVEVDGDVVSIKGVANDPAVVAKAEQAVRDATGTQVVRSEIGLSSRFTDRISGASARVADKLERWIAYLPLIPIALIIVVVGIFIAWLSGRWEWPYRHLVSNVFLRDIAKRFVQAAVLLASCLLALEILNATALVGGVLGAAGVAGIAIGFAFRDLVENYIASILLSLRQPFRPRDHVEIDGHAGLVTAMNSRTTVLTTFDGNLVRIPNATVFKTALINYSREPRRRFSFEVNVGYDVDLAEAVEVGVQTLRDTQGVLIEPDPFAIVTNLGDSSITVQLFGWVDQTTSDFGKVKSLALQNVKNTYDQRDIDMPEPIYKLKLMSLSGSAPDLASAGTPMAKPPSSHAHTSAPQHDTRPGDTATTVAMMTETDADSENLLQADAPRE